MIETFPLFAGLGAHEHAVLEACLHTRTHPPRVLVVSEGDDTRSLYLILEGRVKVFTSDEQGREALLCTQDPGEYFGEISLFDDAGRSASVMTLERTRLAMLAREDLLRCVQAHPGIAPSAGRLPLRPIIAVAPVGRPGCAGTPPPVRAALRRPSSVCPSACVRCRRH
jgi:CRP/FNR family transcriptional regulator, cyclic AMP receptor protein